MRIWSLHPKYLDTKGLVALWRETLLAKNVLEGNTKGYKNHPQLLRFKNSEHPLGGINQYLEAVFNEACSRGFQFNEKKFSSNYKPLQLSVTSGQLEFEVKHLLSKLKKRDALLYEKLSNHTLFEPHPLFKVVEGTIEEWEII